MFDVGALLQRQERWQKSRRTLSWAEKMRMVEAVRESVRSLRRTAPPPVRAESKD